MLYMKNKNCQRTGMNLSVKYKFLYSIRETAFLVVRGGEAGPLRKNILFLNLFLFPIDNNTYFTLTILRYF